MGNCKTKAERKRLIMAGKAKVFCGMLEQMDRDSLFIDKLDVANKLFLNEFKEKVHGREERQVCKILMIDEFESTWYLQNVVGSPQRKCTVKNICPWVNPNQLLVFFKQETASRTSNITSPNGREAKEKELIITELPFSDPQFTEKLKTIVM